MLLFFFFCGLGLADGHVENFRASTLSGGCFCNTGAFGVACHSVKASLYRAITDQGPFPCSGMEYGASCSCFVILHTCMNIYIYVCVCVYVYMYTCLHVHVYV